GYGYRYGSDADIFDAPVGLCDSGVAPIQFYISKHEARRADHDRNGSLGTKDLHFVAESGSCTAKLKFACINFGLQKRRCIEGRKAQTAVTRKRSRFRLEE